MHFDILASGRGVATTLQPRVFTESMHFAFDHCEASGATAVFSNGDKALYRNLVNGECEIPSEAFDGDLHVAILVNGERIKCDSVNVERIGESVVVTPNLAGLLRHIIAQDKEVAALKTVLDRALGRIEDVEEKMRTYYEGFDII